MDSQKTVYNELRAIAVLIVKYKVDRGNLNVVRIYASGRKKKIETENLHEEFQKLFAQCNKNRNLVIFLGLSAKVRKQPIPGMIGTIV
jgi:hypothetical protein